MAVDGCPVCEGAQPMTWMLTHLSPPATVQSCEEHITINVVTLLATLNSVDAAWLYDVVATAINTAADEAEAEPEPVPKRTRKPRTKPAAEPEVEKEAVDAHVREG